MENNESVNIKRILEIAFSKRVIFIIILILVASVMLGYAYSYYYKTPQYKSSVTILLVGDESKDEKGVTQTDLSINSSLISTYSSIAKSENVVGKTIKNLNLKMTIETLQKNIEATQIDKTQFLKISVKSDSPQIAKNIVEELAEVFSEQIKQIYNLENINIIDKAEVENEPCNVNHIKDIVMFAFGGIAISSIIVMLIYIFDDTIKDEKDIEENIKLKNIGTLPITKDKSDLITKTDPKAHIVECLKTIRTNILYSTKKKAILITSSRQKEGKSWIINNIAVTFAQTGKKVILVDTNLRKESDKNKIFNIEKKEGLSDFIKEITENKLENLEKSRKYIQETKIPNLHILSNGTIPPNPSELISSKNMKKLLELLKNMYDVILLDGTSCMLVSDSIALSSMVDSTIIVAESKKTKINDLKKVKKQIKDVDGKILGVILNKVKIKGGKYYGKRYGYYYGKEEMDGLEALKENQKIVPLEDIIKIAEENIKLELENNENIEELENIDLSKENTDLESSEKINYDIESIKNEIVKLKNVFTQIKKDDEKKLNEDIENLKEISTKSSLEVIEKLEKIDYENKFEEINRKIESYNYDNILDEINQKIESNNLEQFMSEVKKLNNEIENLRELQMNNNFELLDKLKDNNYEQELEKINEKLDENNYKIEQNNYEEELAELKEKIEQNNYEEILEKLNEKIEQINYKEELSKLNEQLAKINYEKQLAKLNEKIEQMNYKEELDKLNEKIEKMNYEEELARINAKIQENSDIKVNNEVNTDNVISFETLKEQKRKNAKRVFKIDEDISYEDLEILSTCVIDIKEDNGEIIETFGTV